MDGEAEKISECYAKRAPSPRKESSSIPVYLTIIQNYQCRKKRGKSHMCTPYKTIWDQGEGHFPLFTSN